MVALTVCLSCKDTARKPGNADGPLADATQFADSAAGRVPVYDFDSFQPLLQQKDDKVHVVNFWATWCAPCIAELPHFEEVGSEYPEEIDVLLVSLDMPRMWESHLLPFIDKHQLQSKVVVLDDPAQNEWIPKVNPDWSGAIPATVIYRGKQSRFYEKPFTYEELTNELTNFLNQ